MSETKPAGAIRLLAVGARSAGRSLRLWLLGAGFEAGTSAVRLALMMLVGGVTLDAFLRGAAAIGPTSAPEEMIALGLQGLLADRVVLPLLGLAVTTELLAAVLRLFYLGAAVERLASAAHQGDTPIIGVVAAGADALGRATLASVWLFLLELIAAIWRWVLLGATSLVVHEAFRNRHHGWRAAALAGFAAGLAGVVALLLTLFGRVYFVRAVRGPNSTLAAISEAAALVGQRALTYLGVLIAEVVLLVGAAMLAGVPGAVAVGVSPDSMGVQLAFRLVGSALTGGATAAIELIILGAICAADLDARGELPAPPAPPEPPVPAQPVYAAQEVLVAQALEVPSPPPLPEPEPEPTS